MVDEKCCVCGKPATSMCEDCHQAFYCSEECFDKNFNDHAVVCGTVEAREKKERDRPRPYDRPDDNPPVVPMIPPPPPQMRQIPPPPPRETRMTYYNAPLAPPMYPAIANVYPGLTIEDWFGLGISDTTAQELDIALEAMSLIGFYSRYKKLVPALYYWLLDSAFEQIEVYDHSPDHGRSEETRQRHGVKMVTLHSRDPHQTIRFRMNTGGRFGELSDLILVRSMITFLQNDTRGTLDVFSGQRYIETRTGIALENSQQLFFEATAKWINNTMDSDVLYVFTKQPDDVIWTFIEQGE